MPDRSHIEHLVSDPHSYPILLSDCFISVAFPSAIKTTIHVTIAWFTPRIRLAGCSFHELERPLFTCRARALYFFRSTLKPRVDPQSPTNPKKSSHDSKAQAARVTSLAREKRGEQSTSTKWEANEEEAGYEKKPGLFYSFVPRPFLPEYCSYNEDKKTNDHHAGNNDEIGELVRHISKTKRHKVDTKNHDDQYRRNCYFAQHISHKIGVRTREFDRRRRQSKSCALTLSPRKGRFRGTGN